MASCATLKRRLEALHPPESENPKRQHVQVAAGGGSPGLVTLDKGGMASPPSPTLTQDQVSAHIQHELIRLNRDGHRQVNNEDVKSTNGLGSLEGYPCDYQFQDDKPIFTSGDVEMICERMLKEREEQLQAMYDQALKVKMAEQYDNFVKFTHDQMQKGAYAAQQSYLS